MDQRGSFGGACDHSKWPQHSGAILLVLIYSLLTYACLEPTVLVDHEWLHWLARIFKWILIVIVSLSILVLTSVIRISDLGSNWIAFTMVVFHILWMVALIAYPKLISRDIVTPETEAVQVEFLFVAFGVHAFGGGVRSRCDRGMVPLAVHLLKIGPLLRLLGPLELLYSVSFYSYKRQVTVPLRQGVDGRRAGQQTGGAWKNGVALFIGVLCLVVYEFFFLFWFTLSVGIWSRKYQKLAESHWELVACMTDAKMISKSMVCNKVESYITALGSGRFVDWNGHQITNGWESDPADSGRKTLYACLPGEPTGFRLIYDGPKSKVTWIREDDRGKLTWQFPWKEQPSDEVVCVWLEYLLCGVVSYKGRLYSDGWSGLGDGEKTDSGHVVHRYL